jgi:uncharacterized protein with HEPN domain
MDNIKDDHYYLSRIIFDMQFINKHMRNTSPDKFNKNEVLQDSMMFRLIQISENAKRLSEQYKSGYCDVPWNDIYGLRNRIVHEYGHVDLKIIYETLVNDIPEVLQLLNSKE